MLQIDPTLLEHSREIVERSRNLRERTWTVFADLYEELSKSREIVLRSKEARKEREQRRPIDREWFRHDLG